MIDATSSDPPGRLAESVPVPLAWTSGAPLAPGIVTGRIYDDLAAHAPARMRDLAALGTRVLRIEIERDTPWTTYATIVNAAREHGITILALVSANSLPVGTPGPLDGSLAEFDTQFIPAYIAAIDRTVAELGVQFVEVWNEPDVYGFSPMFSWTPSSCERLPGGTRYALLAVRVFETMVERRVLGIATPTLAAFGVSRQDDTCLRTAMADAESVRAHRLGYRPQRGLPDGLPTDILAMHGYGNAGRAPSESGYTYAGGTFAAGVDELLDARFADGPRIAGVTPVWYTEVGYSAAAIGGAEPRQRQADALTTAFDVLRARPQITAAFWYDYRDDEAGGGEGNECGLRESSATGYAPTPGYLRFQTAGGANDLSAPAGALLPLSATVFARGASLELRGWAIDADGVAPMIEVAIDGNVVAAVGDGNAPAAVGCEVAWSVRCPDRVGFAATVSLPVQPGIHEVAVRARDAAGLTRVVGRVDVVTQ